MDTKRVALTATFAALAIVLNPDVSRLSFPAPFLFFLPYQFWEIPIFIAFILLGPKPGLFIAAVGSLAIIAFHPGIIAFGGVVACLAMLTGFYIAYKLLTRKSKPEKPPSTKKTVLATTAGGVLFRVGVMVIQNYFMLPLMGLNYPVLIPLIALFNATEPLYVIPISYLIAKTVDRNLKIGNVI